MNSKYNFDCEVFATINDLDPQIKELVQLAKKQTKRSYAPYSNFHVGAALLLENGEIYLGCNQENASYPEGLCAERVAIHAAATQYPNVAPIALALSTEVLSDSLIAPCGGCRQVMAQFEVRHEVEMPVIMTNKEGFIYVIPSAMSLLPWCFDGSVL